MDDRTKVILKAKDGRRVSIEFDTYEEASKWIAENTTKYGIQLELTHAQFDREPTIEVYKEVPPTAKKGE